MKNTVFEVVVEMKRTEIVTFGIAAASKEEAIQKAIEFDYIDIDFDQYSGDVEYFWDEALVVEA